MYKVVAYNNHNGELVGVLSEHDSEADAEKDRAEKQAALAGFNDYLFVVEANV